MVVPQCAGSCPLKVVSALGFLVISMLGILWPIWLSRQGGHSQASKGAKTRLEVANCFTGGVMLAVSFTHLLPEAIKSLPATATHLPFMSLIAGYLVTLLADRLASAFLSRRADVRRKFKEAEQCAVAALDLVVEDRQALPVRALTRWVRSSVERMHPPHTHHHEVPPVAVLGDSASASPRIGPISVLSLDHCHCLNSHGHGCQMCLPPLPPTSAPCSLCPSEQEQDHRLGGDVADVVLDVHAQAVLATGLTAPLLGGSSAEGGTPRDTPRHADEAGGGHHHGPHLVLRECEAGEGGVAAILMGLALSFHSTMEGMALGIRGSSQSAMLIAAAILAHKGLTAVALGSTLVSEGNTCGRGFWGLATIFSLSTPVGITVGALLEVGDEEGLVSGLITAAAAGTFAFVACVEVIPKGLGPSTELTLEGLGKLVALSCGASAMTALSLVT